MKPTKRETIRRLEREVAEAVPHNQPVWTEKQQRRIMRAFKLARFFAKVLRIFPNQKGSISMGDGYGGIADSGLTITELVGLMPAVVQEVYAAYSDDHKVDAKEVVTLLASFLEKAIPKVDDPEMAKKLQAAQGILVLVAGVI